MRIKICYGLNIWKTHACSQLNMYFRLYCRKRWQPLVCRGRLSIKMSSYQYRHPHLKDKTVSRPSYLKHGNPHTWESLYTETGPWSRTYWGPGLGRLVSAAVDLAHCCAGPSAGTMHVDGKKNRVLSFPEYQLVGIHFVGRIISFKIIADICIAISRFILRFLGSFL